jgi:[protein-PII] uridylyltransferase
MALRDAASGLTPGSHLSDSEVVARLRALLPDVYFVNTPLSRMRRHLALLDSLSSERIILDFHRPPGAHYTELVLCSFDDTEPGLLSKVAGTLVALKINVHTAWIHTLSLPQENNGPRQVVLDTLILSEPYFRRSRPLTLKTQAKIRDVMRAVLNGDTTVTELLIRQSKRPYPPLLVYELSAQPAPGPWTLIKLRAADDNGVLFRVTRALAALGLDIAHAQINTFEREVDDVFFVATQDGPLTPDQTEFVLSRLRAGLLVDSLLGAGE